MMKTPLVIVCLVLVTLAVKASAEGNTGTEDGALSRIDDPLPPGPGGNPGGSIDIDETGTTNEESRGRGQEVEEPAEDEEKNFFDEDNEKSDGTKDDLYPYEYTYENDARDNMKLSSQQGGSPLAPGTGIQDGNQASFSNPNADLNRTAGSISQQGSASSAYAAPKLPDLPALPPVEGQLRQASSTSSPALALGLSDSSSLQQRLPGLSEHESGTNQSRISNLDTAGGEGLLQPPKLPNLPSLLPSNPPNLTTGDSLVEQINLNSKILSTERNQSSEPFMTGTQVDGGSLLNTDEVNQNQRLPASQSPNLRSFMGPGPVFLPTAGGQEFQPSSTVAFNTNMNDQTGLKTIQDPSGRFGDGNKAPSGLASNTDPTRMALGDEGLLSKDDPDRGNYSPLEEEEEEEDHGGNLYPDYMEKDHIDLDDQTEQKHEDEDNEVPDGDNANSYDPDYYGEDREEGGEVDGGEVAYHLPGVEDPGHNVPEEPSPMGRPEATANVRMGAADATTVKTKAPNKPTNMVLFYTWLILIVLTAVVTISTCKSRIVGMFNLSKKGPGHQRHPEEGKRLLDQEYV